MTPLIIIYRLCEESTNPKPGRPEWFSKMKCLKSFIFACVEKHFIKKIIFVHDGCEGELFEFCNFISNKVLHTKYELIKINESSNEKSLIKCYEIADKLKDGSNIYFVEDDYLHLPDSVEKIASAVAKYGLLTGYDHPDRYTRTDDMTYAREFIDFDQPTNHHWRTAESTCCTYAVSSKLWHGDVGFVAKQHLLNDRQFFRTLLAFRRRLFTPIPALTTQVDGFMSPGIDWEKFNQTIE